MTTIRNFERALGRRVLWSQADARATERTEFVRPPAHLPARPARGRTPTTARRRRRCCSATSRPRPATGAQPAGRHGVHLPVARHHRPRDDPRAARRPAPALHRADQPRRPGASTRRSPTSWPCSSTSPSRRSCATRSPRPAGDLASQNLLGQLAQQFGQAIGNRGALRDALGEVDRRPASGSRRKPDPAELQAADGAARPRRDPGGGGVRRLPDHLQVAHRRPAADRHRRHGRAARGRPPSRPRQPPGATRPRPAAGHVLNMCIRALDYCPPVDLTFGDYLRALITADRDLVPDDDRGYRIAVIEAFRRRGIYPRGVRSLSAESLCWAGPVGDEAAALPASCCPGSRSLRRAPPGLVADQRPPEGLASDDAAELPRRSTAGCSRKTAGSSPALRARPRPDAPRSIDRDKDGLPLFEVHSVRPARRLGPDGQTLTDLVIEITQRGHGYLDPELAGRRSTRGRSPRAAARLLVPRRLHGAGRPRPRRGALLHRQGDPEPAPGWPAQRGFVGGQPTARCRPPTSATPGGGSRPSPSPCSTARVGSRRRP